MSNTAQSLASKRINSLLDANSFVEIGGYVTARSTDFNMQQNETPSLPAMVLSMETWFMCTARTHLYWAEQSVKCTQRKL